MQNVSFCHVFLKTYICLISEMIFSKKLFFKQVFI